MLYKIMAKDKRTDGQMSAADRFLDEYWTRQFYRAANAQMLEDQREHLRYSGISAETAVALMKACEAAAAEPSTPSPSISE